MQSSVLNQQTGQYDDVTLFYSRRTGKQVNGIDMRMDSGFTEGLAPAWRQSGGAGYVDGAGRIVIPFKYFYTHSFHEGVAKVTVRKDENWVPALIDRRGEWVVAPGRYEVLGELNEGRCFFRNGERWGFIDVLGQEVFVGRLAESLMYRDLELPVFHCGMAAVRNDKGHWRYVDRYGRTVIEPPDNTVELGDFGDGLACFAVHVKDSRNDDGLDDGSGNPSWAFANRRYGYMDVTGTVVVAPIYTSAGGFSEGLAPVSPNDTGRLSNSRDPMSVSVRFGDAPKRDWGYIDTTGKLVIPFQFRDVGQFSEGLARARKDGNWGYINKTGQFVIPERYGWAGDFQDGIAEVWSDGHIVFIDRTGAVIVKTDKPATTF